MKRRILCWIHKCSISKHSASPLIHLKTQHTQLRSFLEHYTTSSGMTLMASQQCCVSNMVSTLHQLKFARFPSTQSTNMIGSRIWYARWDSWIQLMYDKLLRLKDVSTHNLDQLSQSALNLSQNDPNWGWKIEDFEVKDLATVVKQDSLPTDWLHRPTSKAGSLTDELDEWLEREYTIKDSCFILAMVASLIITACAPFHKILPDDSLKPAMAVMDLCPYYSKLGWTKAEWGGIEKHSVLPLAPLFHKLDGGWRAMVEMET